MPARSQAGWKPVAAEFESGAFVFAPADEDIHTAVERRLGELIGPVAGKLHTGRSRNDQVATDFRLWLLDALPELDAALRGLQAALVERAEARPGRADAGLHPPAARPAHPARPLVALRTSGRCSATGERLARPARPHGGPAAGLRRAGRHRLTRSTGLPWPRSWALTRPPPTAWTPSPTAISPPSSSFAPRWPACISAGWPRAVILFSTAEFGFFELSDAYSTGSSLMPQKKNPDMFELARGKAGTLIGLLTGLLATLKGLPSAYDKDLQEDKLPVFEAADTLLAVLPVLAGALRTLAVHPERMRRHRRRHAGHRPGRLPGAQGHALPRGARCGGQGGPTGR